MVNKDIILSQADGRPMYLQIVEQVKHKVAIGDWNSGYKLPSIREMAISLQVSVITVKRAYQELENDNVIFTQHGKGSFISGKEHLGLTLKEEELDSLLSEALRLARTIGVSVEELSERLEVIERKQTHGKEGRTND